MDDVKEQEKEVKTSKPAKKRKKITIDIDTPVDKVVSLDKEGNELIFDDEPGRFLDLPDTIVDALSKDAKVKYILACGFHARLERQKSHPEEFATPGLTIKAGLASATARLEVRGKEPGKHYCWKAPHQLRQAGYEGYQIARGKNLETFQGRGDMIHKVGAFGDDELVLMEVPEELHLARRKAVGEKSRARCRAVETNAISELRKGGGVPYIPPKGPSNDGRSWSPSEEDR